MLRYACETINLGKWKTRPLQVFSKLEGEKPWLSDQTCIERLGSDIDILAAAFSPIHHHIPLRRGSQLTAVAMFRNPRDRLASQLLYMRSMVSLVKLWGVDEKDILPLMQMLSTIPEPDAVNASHPCHSHMRTDKDRRLCRYTMSSHFPGIRGCMTKMVLGYNCANRVKLTTQDLEQAKRIVRSQFAFVGLTEQWEESVRLFHGMHGGRMFADELFMHDRVSNRCLHACLYLV